MALANNEVDQDGVPLGAGGANHLELFGIPSTPKVLLADEPSGNLDSENADRLHDLFFDLRERTGQTIVLVTHNEALAQRADRTLRMEDGRFL